MADEDSAQFERLQAAFDRASKVAPPLSTRLRLCDRSVRLRVAGGVLAERVFEPFAHLRRDGDGTAAQLEIDLWDAAETGVSGLARDSRHATGRQWALEDGSIAISLDGRFISHELRGSFLWLDRVEGRLRGWIEDARELSLRDRGKPVHMMLAVSCGDEGMQPIHAGLVERDGDGVLVTGPSGAGKSTVALACLEAGYGFVGDDWIALRHEADDSFTGHGLYAAAFLDPDHAARFPALARHAIPPRGPDDPKSLLLLGRAGVGALLASAKVRAIALPRLGSQRSSSFRRASKREAMLMLAPSSVFAMRPRAGRAGFERLAQLVDRVPAYWLEIGADVTDIPRCVDGLLGEASGKT